MFHFFPLWCFTPKAVYRCLSFPIIWLLGQLSYRFAASLLTSILLISSCIAISNIGLFVRRCCLTIEIALQLRRHTCVPVAMPSIYQVSLALPAFFLAISAAPAPYPVKLFSRQTPAPTTAETSYQCFTGKDFPPIWLSWDQLLAINEPAISAQNSPGTTQNIISAIQSVSNEAGILP